MPADKFPNVTLVEREMASSADRNLKLTLGMYNSKVYLKVYNPSTPNGFREPIVNLPVHAQVMVEFFDHLLSFITDTIEKRPDADASVIAPVMDFNRDSKKFEPIGAVGLIYQAKNKAMAISVMQGSTEMTFQLYPSSGMDFTAFYADRSATNLGTATKKIRIWRELLLNAIVPQRVHNGMYPPQRGGNGGGGYGGGSSYGGNRNNATLSTSSGIQGASQTSRAPASIDPQIDDDIPF